jgi:Ner family transcriptional regulator
MPSPAKGMHREDIKAAIRKRGKTLEALSEEAGYSKSAVGMTLRKPWPAVEKIIADFIGKKPLEIWPDRYDALGRPNRQRRSKVITLRVQSNVRNEPDC